MSDDRGPVIEALDAESLEEARHQLAFLEESMGSLDATPGGVALMDEAYRAAHFLKTIVDGANLPQVARIARLVQDTVRASRSGRAPVGPALGALLPGAARAARESLEARPSGGSASSALAAAVTALESLLASPFPLSVHLEEEGPLRLTRVERRRLEAAAAASQGGAAAAAEYARAAQEAAGLASAFRDMAERQELAAREALEAIPRALAAAASGESAPGIARDLADRVSRLSIPFHEMEDSLSHYAARAREAAGAAGRALAASGDALARIGGVRLSAVLSGALRAGRRASVGRARPVQVTVETGKAEIGADYAELAGPMVNRIMKLLLLPGTRPASKHAARGARKARPAPTRLAVEAEEQDGVLLVRVDRSGEPPRKDELTRRLEDSRVRLDRKGVVLTVRSGGKHHVAVTLSFPARPLAGPAFLTCVLARAGDAWYAIPSASVVEYIAAAPARGRHSVGGTTYPVMVMEGVAKAAAGAVLRSGTRGVVLLFDAIEGETLVVAAREGAAAGDRGIGAATVLPDGSVARLIDVDALVSSRDRPPPSVGKARPRKR